MINIKGLSEEEVIIKLKKYGYNELSDNKESDAKRLLKKFWSPIPGMIETAALLSAILGRWDDFFIIIILLFVNILVDYKQELKALSALEILKKKLAKKALVVRDGKFKEIDARYLVPGDIIKIKIGDVVPADTKLIKGKYLEVDQSMLTGESLPVDRVVGEQVYSNSIVKMGEMLGEVINIGGKTFFGKSASLVEKARIEEKSHFQKAVIRIGNFLIFFSSFLAILIILVSLFRHDNFLEVLQFILVLIIASVPVALPAVLSVTMAVGAIFIARKKAIISHLPAIEELAGVDVLCIDKTGTLTQNKMSISQPIVYSVFTQKNLFTYAILASQLENNDPIEKPIFDYFQNNFSVDISNFHQLKFTPFNPISKKTEVIVKNNNEKIIITKGAPQVIIALCDDKKIEKQFLKDVHNFAQNGDRTLAVAIKKKGQKKFECVGLIPLSDPPRHDSAQVVEKVKEMGIDIKMLTGDHYAIAVKIAKMLNIGSYILDTPRVKRASSEDEFISLSEIIIRELSKKSKNKISPKDIKIIGEQITAEIKKQTENKKLPVGIIQKYEPDIIKFIENTNGFSQVMPKDKYFIIEKLQKNNHIVAMTGDGVNDAPALKKADIGIAVSGATDAARAAADLILLSPGLGVINHAIRLARQIFERMKGYAIFRIAETMRIILFMSISIIVFNFYPITAIMIIVLALLNDVPVMMIAYDNAPIDDNPVRWDMREVLTVATVLGLVGVISSFSLFYWLQINNYSVLIIQTLLFIKLDVAGHSTLYLTRAGRHHFWHKPFPSLKFFLPAFGSRIIGTLIAVYGIFMAPIGWQYAGYMWVYALVWWIFNDYVKVLTYKFLDRKKK